MVTLLAFSCAVWLLIGLAALLRPHSAAWSAHILFPLGALNALVIAVLALFALGQPPSSMTVPLGLPGLPFHLRLDSLSAWFLLLLGATAFGVSVYAAGYFRQAQHSTPGVLCLHYHLFLAAMGFVLLADDAYFFLIAWETMALSSFLLVTTDHRHEEIRRAGFLYLLMAHLGAIALLLCFGVLHGLAGAYTFEAMRASGQASAFWGSSAFILALLGFGAKAGLLPLHVWLPEAHPAAPSPVSALMSAVMLKTAIYGFLRVSFDLLSVRYWWWGVVVLVFGLASALYGAIFAAVQSDMKRLLAYSSIENIGFIFCGIGLALTFHSFDMKALSALALAASLYHALSHASFKSLLFLVTGSVLHATGERNLGRLGGLMRFMPAVAWLALIGTLSCAGLPPLSGFIPEWLLLQAFLFTPNLPHGYLHMLIPLAAAALAMTAALAAYVMVKFFGIVFLGQPREPKLLQAHDAGKMEVAGLVWLALLCFVFGLLPAQLLQTLAPVLQQFVDPQWAAQPGAAAQPWANWLWLAPISQQRASYSAPLFLISVLGTWLLIFLGARLVSHGAMRRDIAWGCGLAGAGARVQDTAEGFGQPIRHIFAPFLRMSRTLPKASDTQPRYEVQIADHFWHWLYLPIARAAAFVSQLVSFLQRGRIATYLLYGFVTLLCLLFFAR